MQQIPILKVFLVSPNQRSNLSSPALSGEQGNQHHHPYLHNLHRWLFISDMAIFKDAPKDIIGIHLQLKVDNYILSIIVKTLHTKVEFSSHISWYIQFHIYKSLEKKFLKIKFFKSIFFLLDVCKYMIYNVYTTLTINFNILVN